jgi:hypothetical protein
MDDPKKKPAPGSKPVPDEKWLERLGSPGSETPAGVTTYVGLLRQSTRNESEYQLYQTLDMGSCLHIQKSDVLHIEELPADKSPFGSLGGARVFVRLGAKIKSVKTSTSTFEAGADDFDLDIRVGAKAAATGGGGGDLTIPDTGCGDACNNLPPFSDPDVGPCKSVPQTFCGCTGKCTLNTCGCPPTGQPTCKCNPVTVPTNCVHTCVITNCGTCATCATNCGTCQTCNTNCGTCQTCHTCATNCGTCRVNTCATKCGQETCIACTHINTRCPGQHCQIP